jgi:AcrR family transcriptional regulator
MPKILATEEQWIETGMAYFAKGGAKALVVEKIAAELGTSKSSFYWYFSNRGVYLQRIVEEWTARSTTQVMELSVQAPKAEEQLQSMLRQMFSVTGKGDFLFYLRKLALQEPSYASVLQRIEQARMGHAKELFIRRGFPDERASHLSWMLYHYYLGWYERHKNVTQSAAEVERHLDRLLAEWSLDEGGDGR